MVDLDFQGMGNWSYNPIYGSYGPPFIIGAHLVVLIFDSILGDGAPRTWLDTWLITMDHDWVQSLFPFQVA